MQKSGAGVWARRSAAIALTISTMIAAGCGGGDGGGGSTSSAPSGSSTPTPTVNTAPTISGKPASQATVGSKYSVTPVAQDADGDTLAFSIQNRPSWATFNTATGELTGTPTAQNVGASANVIISVSDGKTTVALPAFSITVAQAGGAVTGDRVTLSWDVPNVTVDGSALVDLVGYRIEYGKAANQLTETIEISSAGINTQVVENLQSGTYYFAVRAISKSRGASDLSNIVSFTVS
jgi:hypothetical protein